MDWGWTGGIAMSRAEGLDHAVLTRHSVPPLSYTPNFRAICGGLLP